MEDSDMEERKETCISAKVLLQTIDTSPWLMLRINKLSKDLDQGTYSQDRLQNHFASRNASKTDGEGYQYPTMERQGKNQINLAQRSEVLRTGPDRNGYNYSNERSFDDRGQKSYHNLKQNLDNSASNHRVGGKKLFSQNLKNLNYIDYLKQFK